MPDLLRLLAHLSKRDPLDLEEEHVALFDRTRSLSLNLFEHVHGDSRERGPAMVELNGIYQAAGLLPRDAVHYDDDYETEEHGGQDGADAFKAVIFRGHLEADRRVTVARAEPEASG